jgi:hypothetical protein
VTSTDRWWLALAALVGIAAVVTAVGGGCVWLQKPNDCTPNHPRLELCSDPDYALCKDAQIGGFTVWGCNVGRVTCVQECP